MSLRVGTNSNLVILLYPYEEIVSFFIRCRRMRNGRKAEKEHVLVLWLVL